MVVAVSDEREPGMRALLEPQLAVLVNRGVGSLINLKMYHFSLELEARDNTKRGGMKTT